MDLLLQCPICRNQLQDPVTINCGHSLCMECMHKALAIIPRCPLCRSYVPLRADQFKVNMILSELVRGNIAPRRECILSNLILVRTQSEIFRYSYFKIIITQYTQSNLNSTDYISQFTNTEIYIEGQDLSVIGTVKVVQIQNGAIIFSVRTTHQVQISEVTVAQFMVDSGTEFGTKETKAINLPVAKAEIINEQLSLEDEGMISQIRQRIKQFLDGVFHHQILDAIELEVYQKLQTSGLFEYLEHNESIKLSYNLPSLLKIRTTRKKQIIGMPIVKRLHESEKILKQLAKYNHGGMIFDIPNDHPKPPFIQLIVMLIAFISYLLFIH